MSIVIGAIVGFGIMKLYCMDNHIDDEIHMICEKKYGDAKRYTLSKGTYYLFFGALIGGLLGHETNKQIEKNL